MQGPLDARSQHFPVDECRMPAIQIAHKNLAPTCDYGAMLLPDVVVYGTKLAYWTRTDQKQVDFNGDRHPLLLTFGDDKVKLHTDVPRGEPGEDGESA